ncbi:tail fiber domain-containing protein [Flavobacterium lacus]|uniref:Trimeric autotransporter adhesin n=1 Tax=Flavobacterium lacus TaxID=1353778 RepID=A0A328WVY7_9FLAO|nr:tail fiber domain-containing protein [Flavobacterium lacus]RAR50441.1 trimeric autotransporter adhesin [Flavobacterium lacus]
MKKLIFYFFVLFSTTLLAQVGINTTTPNAQLDIRSSNQVAPASTDGMLIPKIDTFPATNPAVDQQGMLVYLTSDVGSNQPGFYYWDNITTSWIPIKGTDTGTLDQAYDFGGVGNGRSITADGGAVTINGTDGLVSTGTLSSGAVAPSGAGTRMVWNPRKAAFRAGNVSSSGNFAWDDNRIGIGSTAFGHTTQATGQYSTAFGDMAEATGYASTSFGFQNTASGNISTAFGGGNAASGELSVAFGNGATASGMRSTAFGTQNEASGFNSTAFGQNNQARSYSETVIGIGATTYTPSTNGATQFRTANATDRLFVIGNAIDSNNNSSVDATERSDAMVVLKNGATGIGSSTPNALLDIDSNDKGVLIPRVILASANIAAPVANPNGGAILESTLVYNTATSGVSPNNVYPGFYYWNGTRWVRFNVDGENNPTYYTAVGTFDSFSFSSFTTLSQMTITFTPKDDIALVNFSAAGHRFDANCINRVIFFQIVVNGVPVTGWQTSANQSIVNSSFFGDDDITTWETNFSYPVNVTVGIPQTIQIQWTTPNCQMRNSPSTPFSAFGFIFKSYRVLTVIDPNGGGGIVGTPPVTTNVWSQNGNTGTNPFLNFVGTADGQPLILKSNNNEGIRIATNGNVGIGSNSPLDRLHVNGNIRMVDGNQAAGRVLTSDINGTASWQNALANAWGITGNSGINPTTNFIGTSDNQSVAFRTNDLERMRLDTSGNLGLGLTTPSERLHVAGRSLFTNGFSADNAALLYQNNTDYMFLGPQSGSSSNGAAMALFGSTNNNGSNLGGINFSVPIGEVRINHNGGNHVFRANSTSGYSSTFELNDVGFQIGHNSASRSILFNPNNTEQMRLTPVGNLGIGTPAPTRKLHLSENTTSTTNGQFYIEQQGTGDALMHIGNTGGRHFNIGVDTSTDSFKIGTSATTATAITTGTVMTLQATGEVGIGTITPSEKLHVSGPAGLTAVRIANTSLTGSTSNVALDFLRGGNANTDWRIFNSGANLTLGNSADDLATINNLYQFQGVRFIPMTDATISLGQGLNRWNTVFASNGTINTSDAREKKNIQNLNYGLNTLMQLRPVSFEWKKDDGSGTKLGLIAQELQQVIPEVVRDWDWEEDEQGNQKKVNSPILGVYYSDLIPVLIKATQEQQLVIEQQKEEINLLKQQLQEQYKSIVERLKKIENK